MPAVDDLLALIDELDPLDEDDYRQLAELLHDEDGEVRYRAAQRIAAETSRETTGLLLAGLDDEDELVRVQCLEELGMRDGLAATDLEKMRRALNDDSELVRRYAAWALADAGDRSVVPLLKERLESAPPVEQSSYCFALMKLGEPAYLDFALGLLSARDYQTRCSVANGIVEFVDDSNRARIVRALKDALGKETARVARGALEEALTEIGASGEVPRHEGWEWVPNTSLGPFVLGEEIDVYVKKYGAALKEDAEGENSDWQSYSLPHSDDYLAVEDGRVVAVTAHSAVMYEGFDLIGLTIAEVEELLDAEADDQGDPVEFEDGDVQVAYDFFDYGLQAWTVDDVVVSVTCLDYGEDFDA